MKADEYLRNIHRLEKRDGLNKAIAWCLKTMFVEIQDLGKARGTKSNSAFIALVNETNDKWKAICRKDLRFREEGFMHMFAMQFPLVHEMMEKERAERRRS